MAESNILEIVQGLAQAAANGYDGAHDERYVRDGEVKKVGLKREEGCPLMDKRVNDGFSIKFAGNQMCIHYQADIMLKEIYYLHLSLLLTKNTKFLLPFINLMYAINGTLPKIMNIIEAISIGILLK